MSNLLRVDIRGRSHTQLWSDAVLWGPPSHAYSYGGVSRYQTAAEIFAFSVIGPEQTIRSLAAACSTNNSYDRPQLEFTSPRTGKSVKGKWAGKWNARAIRLADGAMHCIAMPKVQVSSMIDEGDGLTYHLIVGQNPRGGPGRQIDLWRALYERLLLCYSTPLLPLIRTANNAIEYREAWHWCGTICKEIIRRHDWWKPLTGHPDQTDNRWNTAGRLYLDEEELDALVVDLLQSGDLTIPDATYDPLTERMTHDDAGYSASFDVNGSLIAGD